MTITETKSQSQLNEAAEQFMTSLDASDSTYLPVIVHRLLNCQDEQIRRTMQNYLDKWTDEVSSPAGIRTLINDVGADSSVDVLIELDKL